MRVLILSQHFWPETFRINEVAHSLREAGCEVAVLTGQPNYPDGAVFPGYHAFAAGRDDFDGIPVHRVPLFPRGRSGALRLVGNYLSFLASASLIGPWLLRGKAFDVIFVYGTSPILQVFPALVLRLFKRCAVVTWVQDLWPQSLRITGYVRSPRLLSLVASVVRGLYRRSDLLLVQSKGFLSSVSPMAGSTPVEYHPNPGELAFGRRVDEPPALTLEPGFNIVFAGNLGTVQALETVVAAAALLRDDTHVRFVLIGSGSRGDALRAEVARLGLNNLRFAGRFPPEAMPGILAQASALQIGRASCRERV